MHRTEHLPGIDRRRRRARLRAPVWFLLGALTLGLAGAAVASVVVVGLARAWAWLTGFGRDDGGLIDGGVLGATGPAVLVAAGAALGVAVALAVVHGLVGASHRILYDAGAVVLSDADLERIPAARRFANVVAALSLGLGVEPPELAVIDDPAPNALSVRWGRHRVLAVTSGLLELPRPHVEAVCAHEMAHLHAVDARWISAAEATLGRVRLVGVAIGVIGLMLASIILRGVWWPSVFAIGIALAVIGGVTYFGIERAQRRIRAEADTVADAAAVRLARDPASLGAACAAVAADLRVVRRTSWRAAHAWFALVPDDAYNGTSPSRRRSSQGRPDDATTAELRRRAEHAYADARIPFTWATSDEPDAPLPPPVVA